MVMVYSDDDCVISIILMFSSARAPNIRAETPIIPTSPLPFRVTSAMSSIEEIPLIPPLPAPAFFWISVPGCSGLKVFLRSEEHTSELQSRGHLVCRLLLEKKND